MIFLSLLFSSLVLDSFVRSCAFFFMLLSCSGRTECSSELKECSVAETETMQLGYMVVTQPSTGARLAGQVSMF